MSKNPIFIHSLFRTGSTYIWNKFRQNPNYYCYYEPFHEILAGVNPKNIEYALTKNYDRVKHPRLDRYYLYEYKPLLENGRSGIPYFKKSFAFEEFCNNETNPDLRKYIDYLIQGAGNNVPVLQFNRSALRVKWFKQNYPGSLNIYLVRNPRDQWESYVELYQRSNYMGFFLLDLIIAGMNKDKKEFLMLADQLPLFRYNSDQQQKENDFYRLLLNCYSEEEKYLIFSYTWFRALLENVLNADFILNINLLSEESAYKRKVTRFLKKKGIHDIDFKDAKITGYTQFPLISETMAEVEESARKMVLQSMTEAQIADFSQRIPREDKNYFRFKKKDFIRIGEEIDQPGRYIPAKTIEKFEMMVSSTVNEWLRQSEINKKSEYLLKEKDQAIIQKDEELQKKDLYLSEKDEQLKQKDDTLAEKDRLLIQKDEELQNKDLYLSEKDEQLKQKDKIITEKDRLIFKEDGELQRKLVLLTRKSERLKRREELIAEKDLRLTEIKEQLKQKDMMVEEKSLQLSGTEEQLMQAKYELEKIQRSYTYRFGRAVVFPLKAVKRLSKKILRLRRSLRGIEIPFSVFPGKYEKKINLEDQLKVDFGKHRSGWIYAVRNLKVLHNPQGVLLDSFIERTFSWHPQGIKPHLQPWIGFIHVPPEIPKWFSYKQTKEVIFNSEAWKKSLPHCRGLFTLSQYHRKYLEHILDIPVNNLLFPTETSHLKWDWDKFSANKKKKIVQVGWWLRQLHAIYQLPVYNNLYKKIFLSVEHKNLPRLLKKERDILLNEGTFNHDMYETAETVTYLSNHDYDKLLAENIVFVRLYDASANNTVIECISRNTPILINPLEAVKEYLGEDYPLYYHSLEEAAEKAADFDLLYKAHRYLTDHPIKRKLTGKYFLESFAESQIYRNLNINGEV